MKQKSIPHTTHNGPPAAEAPSYFQCPECGFLSADARFGAGEVPCPDCHSSGARPRAFPSDRLRRLDERIRHYNAEGDWEVVVILAETFLESILEDIIDRILAAHGADVTVRSVVLDGQRAIGARIGRLFPALTGEEFEEVAAELGFRDFPHRWRVLRGARNAFIHDSPFHGPQEKLDPATAHEAMILLDQAYKLFVLINNRFVADGFGKHGR
ncbi:MAG: hypothetical protein FDZ70_08250 [Actinobacteria bacterium]|nr:MAG: hypothetical protein FDZ70_08250 [Actinomycetota bacterium]